MNYGYKTTSKKINQKFYRDDLKLYAKNYDDLGLLSIMKRIIDDIMIQFFLDKCAIVIFKEGKLVKPKNITLDINTENTELEHIKTYEHLGINKRLV